MRKSAKQLGRQILAIILSLGLLAVSLPAQYAQSTSPEVSVSYEGKTRLPSVGTVRLTVESSDASGVTGRLEISKSNPSNGSMLQTNSIISQYDIKIPPGERQTTILYRTDLGGDTMSSYLYDYSFKSTEGQILGQGQLSSVMSAANESVLLIGEGLSKEALMTNSLSTQLTQKTSLKGMTADELGSYDNFIMGHEDALTLSEEEQALVKGRVYEGARLLILSARGHERKNFGELLLGSSFTQTGMSNLKGTVNLLTKASGAKDYWLETGLTDKGEVMTYGAYGKGSVLLLGFNPFTLKNLSADEQLALRKTVLLQYNGNLKGMETYDYQLLNISAKLPEKAVPSFPILLLVFGLSLSFGLIFGMYLVRYKKRPHGLLIGMCSAAALSIVMIPLYSWMIGYKGAMINEVVMNRIDEQGNVTTERYAGIKGNKGQLVVQTDNQSGLAPSHFDFYSNQKRNLVQTVGEGQNQWLLTRSDKWKMETFASKAIRQNGEAALMVTDLSLSETRIKGTLTNNSSAAISSPVLFVDDRWVVLPAVEKGQRQSFDFEIAALDKLTDESQMSVLAQGKLYYKTDKVIAGDEFRALMEAAKNKQNSRAMLVGYQSVEGSGISLENESEKYRQLICYSISLGGKSHTKQLTLSHMTALSGGTRKTSYPNFSEFQSSGDNGNFEFVASLNPALNQSYSTWYDGNQVRSVSIFKPDLGLWVPLKSGETLKTTSEVLYLKIAPLNPYINGDAIKLSEKEGQ